MAWTSTTNSMAQKPLKHFGRPKSEDFWTVQNLRSDFKLYVMTLWFLGLLKNHKPRRRGEWPLRKMSSTFSCHSKNWISTYIHFQLID